MNFLTSLFNLLFNRKPPMPYPLKDVPYGSDPKQTMDVYIPKSGKGPWPILIMVHGGGWRDGDKAMSNVVDNKLAYWGKRFILVFVNYRLDGVTPLEQAADVWNACEEAAWQAHTWGGDQGRLIVMGHSAGAHLVSLLNTRDVLAASGVIALDTAAYNVPEIMNGPHPPLYDEAFGTDKALWIDASPTLQLTGKIPPMLLVARSAQNDGSPTEDMRQAKAFQRKALSFGSDVSIYGTDLNHGAINADLGLPGVYTDTVDAFIGKVLQ